MTGIGMKRDKSAKPARLERSVLRRVSKKQKRRTDSLRAKLTALLTKQVELYGTTRCEAGINESCPTCFGELVLDHIIPRSRYPKGVDGFQNLQVICTGHNGAKGSRAIDYRDTGMKWACIEMDVELAKTESEA